MNANAIFLDEHDPRPLAGPSLWRRAATVGLAAGLVFLLAGDRGARSAVPTGIDPLEVLNLQVRANAIIVLDSSGSMRERPDGVDGAGGNAVDGLLSTPIEGELVGDDQNAKMFTAKQVLKQIVIDNQTKVSFQFGQYVQSATDYGPENPTYLYTCLTTAPGSESACTAAAADQAYNVSGLVRAATDERTDTPGVTTYLLTSTAYHVNRHYRVQSNNTTLCATNGNTAITGVAAWSQPSPATDWNLATKPQPYIEIERFTNTACTTGGGAANTAKYYFRGVNWTKGNDLTVACGGFQSRVALAACSTVDQFSAIGPYLDPEVVPTTTDNDSTTNLRAVVPNSIRSSGPTPIAESIIDIRTIFGTSATTGLWGSGTNPIKTLTPKPRTFVIVVTDGDDTCTSSSSYSASNLGANARRAAYQAQLLYAGIGAAPVDPASKVQTFVVVLGSGADATRANWIAWGGSGMSSNPTTDGPANDGTRWTTDPTPAQKAACPTCVNAFVAANATDLRNALQAAIDQGQSLGEFSDQQSITESVYEFVATVTLPAPSPGVSPPASPNPLNPTSRYSSSVPILLQSTFEMPGFKGHLNAFRNTGGTTAAAWGATLAVSDAGQKLQTRVEASLTTASYTFAALRGGGTTLLTDATIKTGGTGTIKRRIYTTPQNGVFSNATYASAGTRSNTERVNDLMDNNSAATAGATTFRTPIWPPSAAVDPPGSLNSAYPIGILDNALGIGPNPMPPPTGGAAPAAYTFLELQTLFGACTASPTDGKLPSDCNNANATIKLNAARKEARQIILAFTAGAELETQGGKADRTGAPTCTLSGAVGDLAPAAAVNCGALQFSVRPWIMAESTLAAPGVVTAPLEISPPASAHDAEYQLYRDGPRTTGDVAADTGASVLAGFGLRNPDKDGVTTPDTTRMSLKPVMSTIYHATNGMLHALRGGPCRNSAGNNVCLDGATEDGGEELWAFVPYDQLQNLKERMKPQARDPHTYMIATPVRFSDVFVPGTWSRTFGSTSVGGDGVWRTVLVFGRGIAGKYYTALDITAPGPFTQGSLSTQPPIPLWSRGNPDSNNGRTVGAANDITTGLPNNTAADATALAKMGQSWSTPAVANVVAAQNTTTRTTGGLEFVAYTGSGYGSGPSATTEGSTFFTLDMLTGDVVASADVGDRTTPPFDNAIVAGPSGFNPDQLTPPNIPKTSVTRTQRVYFGDVNGRIWKVLSNAPGTATLFGDLGANQPVANSLALLNYKGSGTADRPHIFAETGNDNRVTPPTVPLTPTPPFKMYGLRDDDLTTDPAADSVSGPAVVLFTINFPDQYRGNVQPATTFNDTTPPLGRVFFAGNRFNPPGSANAPTPPPCVSSFDGILFAVGAESGNAAYDLNSGAGDDRFITKANQRIQAVRVSGGRLVVDTGLQADIAPPPPEPPAPAPPTPSLNSDVFFGPRPDATALVAQAPVTFKLGTSVCR
jgi:hypothetical protein